MFVLVGVSVCCGVLLFALLLLSLLLRCLGVGVIDGVFVVCLLCPCLLWLWCVMAWICLVCMVYVVLLCFDVVFVL